MWFPGWLRCIPLLVLVSTQLTGRALAQDADQAEIRSSAVEVQTIAGHVDDPDWAVELTPGQFRPQQPWELPQLAPPAWQPELSDGAVHADGSSLAEQASVVNSLGSSAEIDTSMHTFYAIMAVLGLLAGGICCLQLSR